MAGLFDGVVPFVHTARHLSFRKAAAELGVSPAAVSKAVARLEQELGVELLHRTTRRVALSDEGALFFTRCQEAMQQVRAGREQLARAQRVPRGELCVSLPFVLGRRLIAELGRFIATYPTLHVDLRFTDRKVRLVDERVDVAIRFGPLDDSALVSRKLTDTRWVTAASPAYLARAGTPTGLDDLASHACVRFKSTRGRVVPWTFRGAARFTVPGCLDLDQGDLILDAALAGVGIVQVFSHMARDHVESGRLVEVLPDQAVAGPGIFAVCRPGQRSTPKVRAIMDFLVEAFRA